MYNSAYKVHARDVKNARKHDKMTKRANAGTLHPGCLWAKNHGYMFNAPYAKFGSK